MITHERLKEMLDYDSETGIFTWIVRTSNRIRVGDACCSLNSHGYVCISLEGKRYRAHQLAWLYVYGSFPIGIIDHKDHNPSNNAIENLRVATRSENAQNQIKSTVQNKTSGLLGVCFDKRNKKYIAQITIDGKNKFLGRFKTAEVAHQKYIEAKRIHHPYGVI